MGDSNWAWLLLSAMPMWSLDFLLSVALSLFITVFFLLLIGIPRCGPSIATLMTLLLLDIWLTVWSINRSDLIVLSAVSSIEALFWKKFLSVSIVFIALATG